MSLRVTLTALLAVFGIVLAVPHSFGAEKPDALKQYLADLKKSPDSADLKEKIIKHVQSLKQRPAVPEEYERQSSRGNAFMKKAADTAGYQKAIEAYRDALLQAPWIPEAYLDLAGAQEKAGLFAEAIQNLNLALLADPNAKNARDIRNKIYELEVFAEEAHQALKGGPVAPPPAAPVPVTPVVKKPPAPKKQEAAPEKKTNPKVFVGSWYYKDTAPRGGEEITTHAFTINQNSAGELTAAPPRRTSGATGQVTLFELSGDSVHIQVTWKLPNVPSYWKTEDYELALSGDETKLAGSYKIKSSGSREFAEEKVLFKQ